MIEPINGATPERRPSSPEETRERILAAAREVIARKGKRSATTREIADVAGVNEATLFRHFGSKESLMLSVAKSISNIGESKLRDAVTHLPADVSEALFVLAKTLRGHLMSVRDMMRWSLVEEDMDDNIFGSETWRPHTACLDICGIFFQERVASGELTGEPQNLALNFLGSVFANVLAVKKFPPEKYFGSVDNALRFLVNVFLNGVRSR